MAEKNSNNYISLQEATEYCSYTQEYLSLRARQGKLKAVKIGRNWVTKKEWVKEYIERIEEYNNNFRAKKLAPPAFVKTTAGKPPENLPIEEIARVSPVQLRPALAIALVFVLLIAGGVLGKTSFQNVFEDASPLVQEFSEGFDRGVATIIQKSKVKSQNLANKVSSYTYIIGQAGDIIVENTAKVLSETISDIPHSLANVSGTIDSTYNKIALNLLSMSKGLAQVASPDVLKSTLNTFKEFGQWISQTFKSGYLAFNYFIEEKLDNAARIVLNGLKSFAQGIRKIPQVVTKLFKKEIVIEKPEEEFAKKEEIEKLQKELQALKEEGLPVKEIIKEIEVSRITKIEPIKEITKEIKTLDDQSLKRIRTILSQQETKVEKLRLTASLGYINLPPSVGPSGGVSLTTLGTITAGTWQGTAISTQYGGTGADLSAGAQGGVLYMGGSSIMGISAAGTSGDALISGGTGVPTWTDTPSWSTIILSTSVTSPLYTGTGAVEVSSAGGADLTLDSASGIVQLAVGNSLTVPGTITAQTTGSDLAGTVTVGTLVANTQINTGAGAGTIRINATGDFSNIGDITFTGSPTLAIADTGSITFTDGTNTLMTLADSDAFGTLSINTISPTTINAFTLGGAITGNSQNITNLGQLTVDSLQLDDTTIGLTTDIDLLSLVNNQLTVNGTLALGSNNITMTGSLAADVARVLKGWFTDIESTNMPTVGGTSLSTTFVDVAGDTMGGDLNMGGNIIYGSTADNGDLILRTTTSATKATSYIILADDGGNVGIGTAGPSFKLEVAGDIGPDGHITRDLGSLTAAWNDVYVDTLKIDTGGNIYGIESERIGITASFEPDTASGYSLGGTTKEWANLYIGTGRIYLGAGQESSIYASANDLILSPSGNVGIGTTNPSFKLQVAGNIGPNQAPTLNSSSRTLTTFYNDGLFHRSMSMAIATDGLPIIAVEDYWNYLNIFKCSNLACTSGEITSTIYYGSDYNGKAASLAIGTDGLPIISHGNYSNNNLLVTKCHDSDCSSYSNSEISYGGDNIGNATSIAIAPDGLPVISYINFTDGDLMITKCGNNACSSGNTTTQISDADNIYLWGGTSIVIGTDGLPIISYMEDTGTDTLKVTKCGNAACSSGNTTTQITGGTDNIGNYNSIAIGADGLPIISYQNTTDGDLMVTKCGNAACSSGNTTTQITNADSVGSYTSITIAPDGLPIISYRDTTGTDTLMITKCGNAACSSGNTTTQITNGVIDIGDYSTIAIGTDGLPIVACNSQNYDLELRVLKCVDPTCGETTADVLAGGYSLGGWMANSRSYSVPFQTVNTLQIANPTTFQNLSFLTAGSERLTITPSGKVGIYGNLGIGTVGGFSDGITKLPNPAALPAGNAWGASFSPDGTYLAIAHDTTPFVTIYKRSGDTFTKLANPHDLPAGTGTGASFSPDGTYLAIAHDTTPFVTIYKRSCYTFNNLANPT